MTITRIQARRVDPDHGHVMLCGQRAVAWYRMDPVRWQFQDRGTRLAMVRASAQRLALLPGRKVTWRKTSRPTDPATWEAQELAAHPRGLPCLAGSVRFTGQHLAGATHAEHETYVGVELQRSPLYLLGPLADRHVSGRLADEVAQLDEVAAGAGWDARPATDAEMAWLFRRSMGLGCPAPTLTPGDYLPRRTADWDEFVGDYDWTTGDPYDRAMRVYADQGAEAHERWVTTMMLGRVEGDLDLLEPLLSRPERVSFPVEVCVSITVRHGEKVGREMRHLQGKIMSQVAHYREHNMPEPLRLSEQAGQVLEVSDALEHGGDLDTQVHLWAAFAVSGANPKQAVDRAELLRRKFSPKATLKRPQDQHATARRFIPCEKIPGKGPFMRRGDVQAAAALMPQAVTTVGHRSGFYLGYTAGHGDRHPVFWEPHRSTERRERSGLALIAGGLGAGKSTLGGSIVCQAVDRRIRTFVLDPSKRMDALTRLPEWEGHTRHADLIEAQPGTLNPYALIPDPRPDRFASTKAFRWADHLAQNRRRSLLTDVLFMFLPTPIANMPETMIALHGAVADCPATVWDNPRRVLDKLWDVAGPDGDAAVARQSRSLAQYLGQIADEPAGQLVFPTGDDELDYRAVDETDIWLTVITMSGLQLPAPGKKREEWTSEETMSVPRMYLAGWLLQRSIYEADPHEQKLALFEEAHTFNLVPSGQMLLRESSRNSRKANARIILSSQDAVDLLAAGVGNWLDCVWGGRTEDPAAQEALCRACRIPVGCGYEDVFGGLSPHSRNDPGRSGRREFVMADGEDGIAKIVVDLDGMPAHRRKALDTTPDGAKAMAHA